MKTQKELIKEIEKLGDVKIEEKDGILKVAGNLDLSFCPGLTELPVGLSVGGRLDLSGCTELKELPRNLKVGGYLNLSECSGWKKLPENLKE